MESSGVSSSAPVAREGNSAIAPLGSSQRRKGRGRPDRDLVAAIDIGGSKVACIIADLSRAHHDPEDFDIVGLGQHGAIAFDRHVEMEPSIRAAVEAAERMAGGRVSSVYVAARGRSIGCRRIGVDLEIAGGCVTREDIDECLTAGAKAAGSDGLRPLHAVPVRYFVDGEPVVGDPQGMVGDVLTADVLGLSVRDSFVANVESLLARCDLDLEEIVAAPFAAAEAVLIEDEKELGVILLDIGARSTDFALYDKGALVACGAVNLGGENITRDIAQIFGCPISRAERVKTLYGSALSTAGDETRLVDFEQLGAPGEIMRHSRAELSAVIAPRLEEIFELALDALPAKGVAKRDVKRAVLTGGGSLLIGAREHAETVMGVKTRLGRCAVVAGAPEAATAPQFAAAIGTLRQAAEARAIRGSRTRRRYENMGWLGRDLVHGNALHGGAGLIGNVGAWLRANF